MAQAQFEGLLQNLMSEDNNARVQAEKIYQNTKKQQPNEVLQALLQVGRTSASQELRSLAIVLLRRSLIHLDKEKAIWTRLNPQTQALLKEQLLQGVQREENAKVRSDFCEAVVGLAGDLFEESQEWEGFMNWLITMAQSQVDHHRQSALAIISDIAHHLQAPFSGNNFSVLHQLIQTSLSSPVLEIKTAALNTAQSVILQFEPQYRKEMQNLLPAILDTLAACLNSQDEDSAAKALENLISLTDPGFFRPAIDVVTNAMLNVCSAEQLEDSTRQLALEFLISIAENKPKMCTSVDGFAKKIIYILLQWMLEMPDTPLAEWNAHAENDDDEVDLENFVIAQEGLDRICLALPADVVGPIVLEHIPGMIQNQDWKHRFVGAMAISMIGEGCRSVIKPHLGQVVGLILPLFADPHPRVRWAAANTAGQMSTDFGPRLQKQFHADFVPRFVALLGDNENPKVQSHISAALVNFCEKFKASTLKQYLPSLLGALHTLLKETRNKSVQEQVVTAIASVAGCAEKHFIDFYDTFMPILKEILTQANGKDQTMLRGKAMECISLIGISVGKEKFRNDVGGFMDILANIKTLDLESEDPLRDFVLQTWMRVASCLGPDFMPYLSYTMPQVMQSAALDAGFSVSDSSLLSSPDDTEDGWDAIDIGDTRIKVHTVALEEKASACNMLLSFASEMKDAFFPYVQDVSKLIQPLLTFGFHDGVRTSCSALVPHLMNCVKEYLKKNPGQNTNMLHELFRFLFPALLEAIRSNTELEVQLVSLEALHESLAVMESGCLSVDEVKGLTHDVYLLVNLSQGRRKEILAMNPDADLDDSTLIRDELQSEDSMLVELAEVVGVLVKYHTDAFMEAQSAELLPLIGQLIQKDRQAAERQFALCFFDDIVEHGKEKSFGYWDSFMPFMLEYATDSHDGVRQAACYGLGVCAQHGKDLFKPYTKKALELLLSVITKPESREDDNAPPTENAISSVGKIIVYQESELGGDVPELLKLWLSWLPIEVDDIEAKAVHQHLFNLIVGNHPHIFGAEFSNLPKILSIFAHLLKEDVDLVENKATVRDLFKQMQQMGDLIGKACAVLPADQQEILQAALKQ